MNSQRQAWLWPVLVGLVLLVHIGMLSPGRTFMGYDDALSFDIPGAAAVRDSMAQHRAPFWFGAVHSGVPLMENPQFLALDPWQVLFAVLPGPVDRGEEWMLIALLLFSTLCMYGLARSLALPSMAAATAALVYGLNGSTGCIFECQVFAGQAWIPFCLWMWEESRRRPRLWWAFAVGFAQILQTTECHASVGAALACVVLEALTPQPWQSRMKRFGLGLLGGLAAAAMTLVVWEPVIHFTLGIPRAHMAQPGFAGNYHPWNLMSLFLPITHFDRWGFGNSVTLLALLGLTWKGAPAGLRARYGCLAACGVLMSYGRSGLLYPALSLLLPPLRFLRDEDLWLNLSAFGLAILASLAVTRLQTAPVPLRRLAWLAPLLVLLDLSGAFPVRTWDRSVAALPSGWTQVAGPQSWRVYWQFPTDRLYSGALVGRDNVLGRDACCPLSYVEYFWYVDHAEAPSAAWLSQKMAQDNLMGPTECWTSPLLRLLDVRAHWHRVLGWKENPSPLPRYYLVNQARVISDRHQLFTEIRNHPFDLADTVWLEHPAETSPATHAPSGGQVQVLLRESGAVALQVDAPQNSWLEISEDREPGWQASVDGHPVAILPADGALQAIAVPQGRHRVSLFYAPVRLDLVCIASIAGCIVVLAGLAWYRPTLPALLFTALQVTWTLTLSIQLLRAGMPPVPAALTPPPPTLVAPAGSTVVANVRLVEQLAGTWADHEVLAFQAARPMQALADELAARYGLHSYPSKDGVMRLCSAADASFTPSGVTWLELEPCPGGCRGTLTLLQH
ncbi:MAG: hypothetical protein ACYCW6_04810 [Candidatus Xenobia bacterium]